jgi:hypothetical protein
VQRTENPRDGRQVLVRITDEGDRRLQEYVRARELWLERQLAAMTDVERDVLARASGLLDRLAAQQGDEETEQAGAAEGDVPRAVVG